MNKRKVTKRKGSKLKTNNDPGEVFVLPPNLLEELGINLGNIETAPECTSGYQVPDKESILKEENASHGIHDNVSEIDCTTTLVNESSITQTVDKDLVSKENSTDLETSNAASENFFTTSSQKEPSSIIQTANLMKESVFLSPTFISNNRSIIEGEVEIVGNADLVNDAMCKLKSSSENNEHDLSNHMMQGNTFLNQQQDTLPMSDLEQPSNAQSSVTTQETNNDVQATNVHIQIDNVAKEISFDDHADEAYSSDCSSSNVELSVQSNGSTSSDLLSKQNKNNKINIISQQIIDPSQFKAIKSSYSIKENNLIPVTMNTVLRSSYRNSSCYQNNLCGDLNPNMITEYVSLSEPINSDLCDVSKQNLVNENIIVHVLKSDLLNLNNNMNHNDTISESYDSNFNCNILSNVTKDSAVDTQMQEESFQRGFKMHYSSYYHNNTIGDINPNMITEYVVLSKPGGSDLCDSNVQNSVKENITVSVPKGESLNADNNMNQNEAISESYDGNSNCNILSNVTKDSAMDTQMQTESFQRGFKVHYSSCYQNNTIGDINPNMITEYVVLSNPGISDLCDSNEQNYVKENIAVSELKSESLNADNNMNQNEAISENYDSNFNCNILSNVTKDSAMDTQMQEESFQRGFKVQYSSCYQNNTIGDINPNMITECVVLSKPGVSDLCDSNEQNSVKENIPVSVLKGESLKADNNMTQNEAISESHDNTFNLNILSNVSEDVVIDTQMQVESSQYEFQVHSNSCYQNNITGDLNLNMITEYGALSEPADTDLCDVNKQNAESENITIPVVRSESSNNDLNQNTVTTESHNNNFNRNILILSNLREDSAMGTEIQEDKSELNSNIGLSCTLNCEDKGSIKEKNIDKITTKHKEQNVNETLETVNMMTLNVPNFHVDNKHKELTMKSSLDKLNKKGKEIYKNSTESSPDTRSHLKRRIKKAFTKAKKMCRSYKDDLFQNLNNNQNGSKSNVKKQVSKLNAKVKSKHFTSEVKKHTAKEVSDNCSLNKSSDVEIKETVVHERNEPGSQQCYEELHGSGKAFNKPKKVQSSNEVSIAKSDRFVKLDRLGNVNGVQEDKIREIAGYLSQFAEMQKRKKIFKERHNISSVKTSTNKKHATNTKLSIEGVEKPGGSEKNQDRESDQNIKTYERKTKTKPPVKVLTNIPSFNTLTHKINLTDNSSTNTCNDTDLCLCDDFGRLIYYDNESMYEHIHFWNRNPVDCAPDLIFSIFNDNVPGPAEINNEQDSDDMRNFQDDAHIPKEISSVAERKVCWNAINFSDTPVNNGKGSEHIVINFHKNTKNTLQNINKSSVDKIVRSDASNCSGSHAKNTEKLHKNNMVTVSQFENCQETITNTIVPDDGNPKTNKKKRTYSSCFDKSGKPPAKKHLLSSHLPPNVACDRITKEQSLDKTEHEAKIVRGVQSHSEAQSALSLKRVTTAVCGVCRQNIKDADWLQHIASRHNYLSWRVDEAPLDLNNKQLLIQHFSILIKQHGALSCNKCGITRKYAKPFLHHINQCSAVEEFLSNTAINSSSDVVSIADQVSLDPGSMHSVSVKRELKPVTLIKCGVCGGYMQDKDWNSHMGLEHNYLAWKHGAPTLDVDDEDAVREHLYNITKEYGGLNCAKCGLTRKYVKSYLTHIKSCDGLNESQNKSTLRGSIDVASEVEPVEHVSSFINNVSVDNEEEPATNTLIKCGVCGEYMQDEDWNSHIRSIHNYLAWKHGEPTLDIADESAVKEHLYNIMKENGGLSCAKCGLTRKYVKSYLTHIKSCDGLRTSLDESALERSSDVVSEVEPVTQVSNFMGNLGLHHQMEPVTKCGVCGESMRNEDWISHIGSQHNYLAWKLGEPTLDVDDEDSVREHLYTIMEECGGLKCAKCGLNRKYVKSYLTHIKNCNGPSESHCGSAIDTSLDISEIEPVKHVDDSISNISIEDELDTISDPVQCAVCGECMPEKEWYSHIGLQHNYCAWKYGETILDFDDEETTQKHLYAITKEYGGLKCTKCGLTRKYVKSYLTHVKSCTGLSATDDNPPSDDTTINIVVVSEADQDASLSKCGVCGQYMPLKDWTEHLASVHNYLAWQEGEPPVDVNNDDEVRQHLQNLVKEIGSLVCSKCGLQRKYAKAYLQHVQNCDGSAEEAKVSKVSDKVITPTLGVDQVKCGVCNEVIKASLWIKHIAKQHDYLAKKVGETPLDVGDEEQVYEHLYNIAKENGGLTCQKCGIPRKYVKSYMEHTKKCGQDLSGVGDTTIEADSTRDVDESLVDFYSGGTCGVCEKDVEAGKWIQHIQKDHNYLAWRKGEKPWDLDNLTEVNEHLYEITKKMDGLTCNKCGLVRKYVKAYLTHIKSCTVTDFNLTANLPEGIGPVTDHAYRCAMCQQEINPADWKNHALKKHYNITWIIGQTPIDIKNPYAVEKYLKEYRQYYGLRCNSCGATRASFAGFYAHIITCGKTEEEIEMFQSVCDICNNKYLCIYKNQHMMIHRVQEYTKELKMSKDKKQDKVEPVVSGKRRAAEKARSVIENYSSDMGQHSLKCSTCGFGADFKKEMQSHKCERNGKDFSEDESSASEGEGSEDESPDSEVDSDISREEEEEQPLKKKRYKEPVSVGPKISKIPFKVGKPNSFVEESDIDFCNAHLTDDTLFPKWLTCEHEVVPIRDLAKYLPPIEESCKIRSGFDWTTLLRFEAKKGDGISIFVGACIVCISWIPLRVKDIAGAGQNFLAVACHNDVDCPRFQCDETPQHGNLIQIWDFGACRELPQIVYGIAHDFGTVWSMDWCPSGARVALPGDLMDGQFCRLGLLAVACSNGSAYIFSVPYPSTVVKNNQFIQKLRPVAELRMTMSSERNVYQATSVTWSKEKGHAIVLVGYADGSTAYYDLDCKSSLLCTMEDTVDVFYPYHDERPHNTCVAATDMYPSVFGSGAACSGSTTGADMAGAAARARAGPRARAQLPARASVFAPHWPAALLAGDSAIMKMAVNELEWTQPARKLGGVSALAGCARCGRVAAAALPALRVMRPHPVYPEFRKPIIGMLEMIPLEKKIRKKVNDEFGMKIEPLSYADAVSKYGIQFHSVSKRDKTLQQQCAAKPQIHFPERFPLADVKSMAFCPGKRHHDRLAVATHSGI